MLLSPGLLNIPDIFSVAIVNKRLSHFLMSPIVFFYSYAKVIFEKELREKQLAGRLVYNRLVYNRLVYNRLVYNRLVYNMLRTEQIFESALNYFGL